jgi:hypothetical protein
MLEVSTDNISSSSENDYRNLSASGVDQTPIDAAPVPTSIVSPVDSTQNLVSTIFSTREDELKAVETRVNECIQSLDTSASPFLKEDEKDRLRQQYREELDDIKEKLNTFYRTLLLALNSEYMGNMMVVSEKTVVDSSTTAQMAHVAISMASNISVPGVSLVTGALNMLVDVVDDVNQKKKSHRQISNPDSTLAFNQNTQIAAWVTLYLYEKILQKDNVKKTGIVYSIKNTVSFNPFDTELKKYAEQFFNEIIREMEKLCIGKTTLSDNFVNTVCQKVLKISEGSSLTLEQRLETRRQALRSFTAPASSPEPSLDQLLRAQEQNAKNTQQVLAVGVALAQAVNRKFDSDVSPRNPSAPASAHSTSPVST